LTDYVYVSGEVSTESRDESRFCLVFGNYSRASPATAARIHRGRPSEKANEGIQVYKRYIKKGRYYEHVKAWSIYSISAPYSAGCSPLRAAGLKPEPQGTAAAITCHATAFINLWSRRRSGDERTSEEARHPTDTAFVPRHPQRHKTHDDGRTDVLADRDTPQMNDSSPLR